MIVWILLAIAFITNNIFIEKKKVSDLQPPSWVFSIWIPLYILMGIVYHKYFNTELKYYIIAILTINIFWGPLSSVRYIPQILIVLMLIINSIITSKIEKPYSYMLIPLNIWLSFALILSIDSLNQK
jgi:tryptophan-rich sensory protein